MTFQQLILQLSEFWASHGCLLQQPLDVEVGAGTMHPETFLRVLGPAHWHVAYVQPCRRPADGRFGENPNRLFKHHQFQVVLKPAPDDVQQLYLDSLQACGIHLRQHDVRFELAPISAELTYGLERLAMILQRVDNVYDLEWASGVKYRDVRLQEEIEQSRYVFGSGMSLSPAASAAVHRELFDRYYQLTEGLLSSHLLWPALEHCLKCSHLFNILDASNSIGVAERTADILRVRRLAVGIAHAYIDQTRPKTCSIGALNEATSMSVFSVDTARRAPQRPDGG